MKRERRFEWWGKTMLLGAGSALAVGLDGGMLSPGRWPVIASSG